MPIQPGHRIPRRVRDAGRQAETEELCGDQMVSASIPDGRTLSVWAQHCRISWTEDNHGTGRLGCGSPPRRCRMQCGGEVWRAATSQEILSQNMTELDRHVPSNVCGGGNLPKGRSRTNARPTTSSRESSIERERESEIVKGYKRNNTSHCSACGVGLGRQARGLAKTC